MGAPIPPPSPLNSKKMENEIPSNQEQEKDFVENYTSQQKNLNPSVDKRDNINARLDIAIAMAGFRELSKVAEKAGYSRSFISKVLHKKIVPTLSQAEAIAKTLNVPLQKIFDVSEIRDIQLNKPEEEK